ncbi:MAG: PKD domain-containing protein [Chloroflexota bacterium]|nr:PKD domain-containing protein [Chloroflexota bacterium]
MGTASTTVVVNNVAPTVNAGADTQLSSGQWLTVNATFTDPSTADTHASTVNWGDGSPIQSVAIVQGAGSGSLTATHQYFVPATYTVTVCVTDDDGGVGCDTLQLVVKRLVVAIDIKPGSFPNSINLKNKGNVPVGVFTGVYAGVAFNATTIDRNSLLFAGASDLGIGKSPQDVDGDGDMDMVFHFDTSALNLTAISTEACLTGVTLGGVAFIGCDSVRILSK